jgi:hypothetical protein
LGSDRASSSCWSFNLHREEFLSAPIHSPLSGLPIGPSILMHVGQQGLPTSLLLAHSSGRCRRTRQKVPRVPILRQATTCPGLQASHHTANLALRLLGAQHDWTSPDCARWIQQSLGGHRQVHLKLSCSTTKYSGACRMDLPGPTTSMGTRTDYSVGPWDYPACATRHLMA